MDNQKQIEEMAEEKNSKQLQIRDKYCLRIQKAAQYRGDCDHEDVPSILVDYEKEIKKELIPENAVVLTREEYEKLNVKYILALEQLENKSKETAEKFAEKVNQTINAYKKKVGEDNYVVNARRLIFEVNEICKEIAKN